ncbi:helicase-related protein [Lichenifustis flavocetrariae]|uniref:Transcription-repair-coupling factor n=1 Tax=Lichenifustis flavocetrariae TaxID=2949735 RepID=A0AA42CLY4_9HYPH|nr:helicase-related protein [Lichenifustis flavocetrariae]MCW6512109.1 DEAD/DEAH box helicase [Lichenifustis flavocetrariae]
MNASVSLLAVRLLAEIDRRRPMGLIVVVDGEQKAEALKRLLVQLAPDLVAHYLPAWDCLPYDRAAPSPDIMGHRMRVLSELKKHTGMDIMVTTPEALLQRLPPLASLPNPLVIKRGVAFDVAAFGQACGQMGYTHADRVDDPGHVAIRGEVVDVFPPVRRPYRIGLCNGNVTTIHTYDPVSQRSTGEVAAIRIDAVSEVILSEEAAERFPGMEHWLPDFYPETTTLLEICGEAKLVVEPAASARLHQLFGQIHDAHRDRVTVDKTNATEARNALAPERLYLSEEEWKAAKTRVQDFPSLERAVEVPRFCLDDKPGHAFVSYVKSCRDAGLRIVLGAARERDLATLVKQAERAIGEAPIRLTQWADLPTDAGAVGLLRLSADHGFADEESGIVLITAADLIGHHARVLSAHAVPTPWHLGDGDFAIGDAVIHLDHGVGVLKGLETIEAGETSGGDAVRLTYAKETDLIIPVEEMSRIWRYGPASEDLALDKLDTQTWQKRRAKIAKEIEETARSLVEMARERTKIQAPKIVPPRRDYERFVEGFAFAPTADQMHAIDDCLRDLAACRPMDRLVVGDVGFGKTEVALRAAAAAVLAGWQVAIVAPTTVLVRQHLHQFKQRFSELGIGVAELSRSVAQGEAEQVKAGLADGSIRLVVGTQALAAPDIVFHKPGLVIVDEEQRFGTADKARIRRLGQGVHMLTLTATPIPRTLQTALVGLQDLSIIATPPARRRPIRTLLAPFDPATIHTALVKEKARGGQSFVVVPRIEDLEPLAATLLGLMPDFKILVGHGRMDSQDVDETMTAFAGGDGDVLLATSIIESGLDVPRANTMVICDADRFGLAELHQLRGRVGRGRQQGVCYLMTQGDRAMSPVTERRLSTLARLDRLGSGMAISAQDLDARGAGDLLGDEQAGHVNLIGLGLYQHLLQRAIRNVAGEAADEWTPDLRMGDAGKLPSDYIPEDEVRINLYARIARAVDVHEVDLLAEEVEDRFGPMPEATSALFAQARLKSLCRSHRIARVDAGPKAIAFTPCPGTTAEALLEQTSLHEQATSRVKGGRLLFDTASIGMGERMQRSAEILHAMA